MEEGLTLTNFQHIANKKWKREQLPRPPPPIFNVQSKRLNGYVGVEFIELVSQNIGSWVARDCLLGMCSAIESQLITRSKKKRQLTALGCGVCRAGGGQWEEGNKVTSNVFKAPSSFSTFTPQLLLIFTWIRFSQFNCLVNADFAFVLTIAAKSPPLRFPPPASGQIPNSLMASVSSFKRQ